MAPVDVFDGGGETGALMARLAWSRTPLGPVAGWPQSLRSAVRTVLSSRYPMLLLWGPEYTQLYNDAYSALIGDQHPAALGGDVRVTLEAGWDVLEPLISEAVRTGVASWVPALRLLLERAGYREEAYFSVSHAPARDDDGRTAGVLTVCSEVTEQVVGERRLRLLHEVSLHGGGRSGGVAETCVRLAETIGSHALDVPFAAVYLAEGGVLRRAASAGAALPDELGPGAATGGWELGAVPHDTVRLDVPGSLTVTGGPWGLPVREAVAVPLPSADRAQPLGVLLAGVSPSRALDDSYRSFFHLLAQQVSVAVRNSLAYQEERRRAETLAELDRVKTAFFTNVSHEFRTPLTLMLGPLADALADAADPLGDRQRERVDTAHRNAGRLLTLVNNLMTFSSLEAGRARNVPQELDLAAHTTELAGVFRSAVERASLRLVVDCPPTPRPTAVDPANWETIVTNLLSNALKFTFVGEIRVTLGSDDRGIRLRVADTGIGIAETDLPHLFDRFHRVYGVRARSHEGSGVGLALVRELTRLLGGDVTVTSTPGTGTAFTVALPWTAVTPTGVASTGVAPSGVAPTGLAPSGVAPTGASSTEVALVGGAPDGTSPGGAARVLADEALGWLADPQAADPAAESAASRILVADDNSDMRAYLVRLLSAQNWQVDTVADGEAALEAIRRQPPSLLLTDVMMPRLDGFSLVRMLRQDEETRTLPIVMLSARAGAEAGVEGLDAGADDYVVKPFTAGELLARIRAALRPERLRDGPARPGPGSAGTTAVIAAGRMLSDALYAATEQARTLLGGIRATTELTPAAGRPALTITAPPPSADEPVSRAPLPADEPVSRTSPSAGEPVSRTPLLADGPVSRTPLPADEAAAAGRVVRVVRDGEGDEIGVVTVVVAGEPPAGAADALEPVAAMIAALATGRWEPDHERRVAGTMRRAVLPEHLPAVPGWELSARHRPAAEAGGAWHDIVVLPGGDLLLAVGEVAGRGPETVVAAGRLRVAVRAHAVRDPAPERILTHLSAGTVPAATVLLARLSPADGVLTWAAAGRPGPVRGLPGEPAAWSGGTPGPPLGSGAASYAGHRFELPAGSYLLLSSAVGDPARPPSGADGMRRGVSAGDVLDAVLDGTLRSRVDDVAAVVLHHRLPARPVESVTPAAALELSWTYPLLPGAAAAMRRDLRAALSGQVDADLLEDLQLAATEAVNNAVEHAQQPTREQVDVRLVLADGLIHIGVQDYGTWRGRPAPMDRGRGALLMNAYGDVRVTITPAGTLVTIERRTS